MSRRYDLLVVDLDGTLLRRDGTISQRNRDAIAMARAEGMDVIIATGRALAESREPIHALQHTGLVVAAGGSLLCDAQTGQTLDRRVLPQDVVKEVTNWLLHHDHKALILKDAHAAGYDYLAIGECEFDPASAWWFDRMGLDVKHIDHIDEDSHPEDTVRAGAVACESRLAPLAKWLRHEMGDRCCLQHWSAVTAVHAIGAQTHLLEVFMPNVNKWTMIMGHCERHDIDPQRVAAIGDGLNDVELIQHAGLGVAMANSCAEVLAVADHVTSDFEQDGVAGAIDFIMSASW